MKHKLRYNALELGGPAPRAVTDIERFGEYILTVMTRLDTALEYAKRIIDNYEMDARSDPEFRAKDGFCQGEIYAQAQEKIQQILDGKAYVEGL